VADTTVSVLIERAISGLDDLARLGEEIDDEWSYVNDLETAWRDRLALVASGRGHEDADPATSAAVDAALEESARISDPHRAIDWLSTLPQVVLIALGETP
jgi:hypothetical protein